MKVLKEDAGKTNYNHTVVLVTRYNRKNSSSKFTLLTHAGERQSLPFLLGGTLGTSWGSVGSFGSGGSSLTTGKGNRIHFREQVWREANGRLGMVRSAGGTGSGLLPAGSLALP